MSEFTRALRESDNRAEQTGMSSDQHFETISDTMEWLDEARYYDVFGSEERLEVHEIASFRVLQAH